MSQTKRQSIRQLRNTNKLKANKILCEGETKLVNRWSDWREKSMTNIRNKN